MKPLDLTHYRAGGELAEIAIAVNSIMEFLEPDKPSPPKSDPCDEFPGMCTGAPDHKPTERAYEQVELKEKEANCHQRRGCCEMCLGEIYLKTAGGFQIEPRCENKNCLCHQ